MNKDDNVYVIPEWQQWHIEHRGQLCAEAESLPEALRLGRIWARKLNRSLFVQSEDGSISALLAGPVLRAALKPTPGQKIIYLQRYQCPQLSARARMLRDRCQTQRERAAQQLHEMSQQIRRLEELRHWLQKQTESQAR